MDLKGKHSSRSCIPVQQSEVIFKKYNLTVVNREFRGTYNNINSLFEQLSKIYEEVSSSTLGKDEEGSVLYFQEKNPNGGLFVVSLCKLKTLEYRIYRKLREKLKVLMSKSKPWAELFKKFVSEIEDLCTVYKPPQNLEHYETVARIAFKFINSYACTKKTLDISNRYLDFLKVILDCKEKDLNPTIEMISSIQSNPADVIFSGDEEDEIEEEKNNNIISSQKDELNEFERIKDEVKQDQIEKEESKTNNQEEIAKKIVILCPPLYIEGEVIEKLKEEFNLKEIESGFRENEFKSKRNISLIHMVPAIKNFDQIINNTFFIILGFDNSDKILNDTMIKLGSVKDLKNQRQGVTFYTQQRDKETSLKKFFSKVNTFKQQLKDSFPDNHIIMDNLEADNLEVKHSKLSTLIIDAFVKIKGTNIQNTTMKEVQKINNTNTISPKKKNVLIIIPLGIPAMGKTTFLNTFKKVLEEYDCEINILSSDVIRKEVMESLAVKHPNYDQQKLFDNSTKQAKNKFFEQLEKLITKTNYSKKPNHLIFLDKNHPPKQAIVSGIDAIKEHRHFKNFNIKLIALLPFCLNNFTFADVQYPFSLTFLFNCLQRAINRKEHETLIGDEAKVVSVVLMFFNLFRNFKIRDTSLKGLGFDSYMQLPLTYEEKESDEKIPSTLVNKLEKLLQHLKPGNMVIQDQLFYSFVEEIKNTKFDFKFPDSKILYEHSIQALDKCFNLFEDVTAKVKHDDKIQEIEKPIIKIKDANIESIENDWK